MGARILIVEDEQIVAADLGKRLLELGHEVVGVAASGVDSIEMAGHLRPELVLMDIRLSGAMDGREAARRIQRATGAPVIFLTANSDVFLQEPNGMVPPGLCLAKPFSVRQLQAAIDVVLKMR